MKDSHRLCALIVSFEPCLELIRQALLATLAQVDVVLVIDNGSKDQAKLAELVAQAGGLFHPLKKNRGIAAAQNTGLIWAFRRGFDAVLLLDQDSVPQPGMVSVLWARYEGLRDAGIPVAAVAPRLRDPHRDELLPLVQTQAATLLKQQQPGVIECDFLIASGMLVGRESIAAIGVMDRRLFIDQVDTEWCLRARGLGWRLFAVESARLSHRLGEGGKRIWLGCWRFLPFHSPLRHYYILRNTLHLCRKPYVPAGFCLRMLWRTVGVIGLSLLLLPDRWPRFLRVTEALGDATGNRMGAWRGRR